ncbi:MAG: glycosyltransferase family 4 protein [Cyanobacteria bacterium P01_A01_bin.83]
MLGAGLNVMGGISSVEKLILEEGVPNVNLSHIPTLEDGSVVKKIFVFSRALTNLIWILLVKKVDLFHIHFSSRGSTFRTLIILLLLSLFRKRIILHAHGSGFDIFYGNMPFWIQRIINRLFCNCNLFITLSDSWKKFYVTNLGLKDSQVLILPNPVKFPLQTNQVKKNSFTTNFLFLGRIGDRKGAFELIEAFAKIPVQQRRQANLIMAGDGEVDKAQKLAQEINSIENIQILNWVNSEERDALLANSDVFVLPSHNEGLPMSIIEAMGFGLSVITTPVGGIPELISDGDSGLLVSPGNIQDLSSSMQYLIENENIRNSLGMRAKKRVESLDISKYCLSLKSMYQSISSAV